MNAPTTEPVVQPLARREGEASVIPPDKDSGESLAVTA